MPAPAVFVQTIVNNITKYILWPLAIGLTVIMLIFAGFLFLTANGDPTKITKAKQAVIWSVIGFVVSIIAYSVPGIIAKLFV